MAVDRNIDFQTLAQLMKNNGDFRIAPTTEIRMGQVIGYDPNFNTTTKTHGWPYVSITLYGDKNPLHKIRFSEWYIPNLGDVVWVALSGPDAWVMGSLAGADKTTIGQLRSPVSVLKSLETTDTTAISASATTPIPACSITTPYLPNRIYRVEASVTFTVSNAAAFSDNGLSASLATAPVATGTTVTATTGFVSVTNPTVSVQVGTGVPDQGGTGRTSTYNDPTSGTTVVNGATTNQEIQTLTIQADLVSGSYNIQNVNGYLAQLQTLLQDACNTGGNVYVSGYGLPSATQIIGMNWGVSTTATGATGVVPSGITKHVNLTGWSPSTTGYFAYTNYAAGTTATNQIFQVIYISGDSGANSPFNVVSQSGATYLPTAYDNTKLSATNPTISKPNVNVTPGSFSKSSYSKVSVGVLAPNPTGSPTYQEITNLDVTGATDGQQFTLTGTQTFWEIPDQVLTPFTWNQGNGPTFDWQLAMIAEESGASSFTITGVSQQMFVYDCGVAS